MSLDEFDDSDLDLGANIPTASFNQIAKRKPFNEVAREDVTKQILAEKRELALATRCKYCGGLKQQRAEGQGKFRMVCTTCKKKKRQQTIEERRETRST